MNLQLIGTSIALAGGLLALVYGLSHDFRTKRALYAQIMVFAVGCFMLSRLYEVVCILSFSALPGRAHVGYMGTVGMVLFLLAGSRGRMDDLIDDRRKELQRYRLLPLIPSAAAGLMTVLSLLPGGTQGHYGQLAILVLVGVLMMVTVYYECKHLIFPDEGLNFVHPIRGANLSSILLNFSAFGLLYTQMAGYDTVYVILAVIAAASGIALVVTADKGVKAWRH